MMTDKLSNVYMEYINNSHSDKFILKINEKDQGEFEEYCEARVSVKTLRLITFFLALCNAYFYCMALINAKSRVLIALVAGSLYLIRNPFVLFVIYLKSQTRKGIKSKLAEAFAPYYPLIANLIALHSVLGLGVFLIARALNGRCDSLDQLHVWACNSEYDSHALPQEIVFSLMFLPIMFSTVFKAIKAKFVLMSWLIAVSCIVISIGIAKATQSIPCLVIYVPISLIMLTENYRENIIRYLTFKRQQGLLQINKQLAEEAQNELRFMIANMAHDLKTVRLCSIVNSFLVYFQPLSAFMNGVETLASAFADLRRSPTPHGSQSNRDFHKIIKENIKNLFNVNQFMTMTVNRCIDYMKASKGIKLEPRLETINLQEVLSMPLNCMRDLQSRIAIMQKPIPGSVCSHIITDLQWFQENLFCLISNAVKYSSHGHISVSVSVSGQSHPRIMSAKLKKDNTTRSSQVSENSTSFQTTQEKYTFLDRLVGTVSSKSGTAGSDEGFVDVERGNATPTSRTALKSVSSGDRTPKVLDTTLQVFRKLSVPTKNPAKIYVEDPQTLVPTLTPQGDEMLLIEVEDTGIGLSDEAKEKLFSPFKQAQRRAGGTGLGLYSLAKRVDALGGYYGVSNRRDGEQGSIFWFAIPYRPDASALSRGTPNTGSRKTFSSSVTGGVPRSRSSSIGHPSSLVAASLLSPAASTSNLILESKTDVTDGVERVALIGSTAGTKQALKRSAVQVPPGKLRILLVDDSLPILKMTSNLLKRHGHVVDQEENGADALKALENCQRDGYHYDVMLIDLNMPVMDGLEATKRLREQERARRSDCSPVFEHQYVFAFSANSDSATMLEAMEAGADDFITKPFSIQTFNDKIEKLSCE